MVPPSKEPEMINFHTIRELSEFVKLYRGILYVMHANGTSTFILPEKYCEMSPSTVYEIRSPYFDPLIDERRHRQIADKAFEQKSREAMIRYLHDQKIPFHEYQPCHSS
jgi:hypothetical protein